MNAMFSHQQSLAALLAELRDGAARLEAAKHLIEFSKSSKNFPSPHEIPHAQAEYQKTNGQKRPCPSVSRELKEDITIIREKTRLELQVRAMEVESPAGLWADATQLYVLTRIYWYVTPFPIQAWQDIMAIAIKRTRGQIAIWFANQRQKDINAAMNHGADMQGFWDLRVINVEGCELRMRPFAIIDDRAHILWTDEAFTEAVERFRDIA